MTVNETIIKKSQISVIKFENHLFEMIPDLEEKFESYHYFPRGLLRVCISLYNEMSSASIRLPQGFQFGLIRYK